MRKLPRTTGVRPLAFAISLTHPNHASLGMIRHEEKPPDNRGTGIDGRHPHLLGEAERQANRGIVETDLQPDNPSEQHHWFRTPKPHAEGMLPRRKSG